MPRFVAYFFLLGFVMVCTACAADDADLVVDGAVTRVVDGDGLEARLGSGLEKVRLHGVDAPEATAPFGRQATLALKRLVASGRVELQPVADDPRDRYDRLVAVVYADGINVNEELVAQGFAWAYRRYLGQVDGDERLCELEASARDARKGLWSQPVERWVPPWIYRERQRALPGAQVPSKDYSRETAADCKAAIGQPFAAVAPLAIGDPLRDRSSPSNPAPGGCLIKGNINRRGEKIYHLPGSASYAETRINTAAGERWFCSEVEAQAAGWRAPR